MPEVISAALYATLGIEVAVFLWALVARRARFLEWLRETVELLPTGMQAVMLLVAAVSCIAAILIVVEAISGKIGAIGLLATAAVAGLFLIALTAYLVKLQIDLSSEAAKNEKLVAERLGDVARILETHSPVRQPKSKPHTQKKSVRVDESDGPGVASGASTQQDQRK